MPELDWHAERSDLTGLAQLDRAPEDEGIDLRAVRLYRQGRVRQEMAARGIGAVILSDPVNIRYATGTRNMQVFSMRNAPSRYLLLTAERSILFEFTGCLHLADGFETVDEVRPAKTASFVAAGPHIAAREQAWAAEMADLIAELVGKGATVGLERLNAGTALALREQGLTIVRCAGTRGDGPRNQVARGNEMRHRLAPRHRDRRRETARRDPPRPDRGRALVGPCTSRSSRRMAITWKPGCSMPESARTRGFRKPRTT